MKLISLNFSLVFTVLATAIYAQKPTANVRAGNEAYRDSAYDKAEALYRQALAAENAPVEASFNLGDALYRQQKFDEALSQFKSVAENAKSDEVKSKAYHNIGNSYLNTQKFKESVEAYKQALKLNPKADDSRYNLAFAQRMLQQQQQQQQQQEQNKDKKDENKDQNKDQQQKQDEQKKKEEEQKKQQEQQDQQAKDQQDKQEQQAQQPKDKMSKEDAQRMLEAIMNEEKNTKEKLKAEKRKAVPMKIEKDW